MTTEKVAFATAPRLQEQLESYTALPRTVHSENWNQALHDDYAEKGNKLSEALLKINFLSEQLMRSQNEIVEINKRLPPSSKI